MGYNIIEFRSKFNSYCNNCHFSIWKGEHIRYNTKTKRAYHANCREALLDPTPRIVREGYGKVDKIKVAEGLRRGSSSNVKHRANRGVRYWSGK